MSNYNINTIRNWHQNFNLSKGIHPMTKVTGFLPNYYQ
nr:MAG TPA: hypothetical protein [Caudoviricetes sp.]